MHLPSLKHNCVNTRRTTLEIVEEAFCCFDASADGYLEREEVERAMTTTSTPGR
jgi:Ca2+-binding EF-hand superfamily protein